MHQTKMEVVRCEDSTSGGDSILTEIKRLAEEQPLDQTMQKARRSQTSDD